MATGIGQGGAQVIDTSETQRAAYATLQHNLSMTNQVLNNSRKTREMDLTRIEELNAQAQMMDAQEIDRDIIAARDWYAEQSRFRNVNTPKFRAEFRQRMSRITGKVSSIQGMRERVGEQIEQLSKVKDPYVDTDSKIIKLMGVVNGRPDNWSAEINRIVSDQSGYKLGDKSKDVAIALSSNQKTVAWEKPTGQVYENGEKATESVNVTFSPFFEKFDMTTGEITPKEQLDYNDLQMYAADNPDHMNALQTQRVDEQDKIIQDRINEGLELSEDQKDWMVLTDEMKLYKALNDDLIFGANWAKQSKQATGIGTVGSGRNTYLDRQASTEEIKQQNVVDAIANDANTIRTRGAQTLNSMNIKGAVPGSFKVRQSESVAGDPIVVIEYESEEEQFIERTDPNTGEIIRTPFKTPQFKRVKKSEAFFADDNDGIAKFYRDRVNYGRNYGPEDLNVRPEPIEKGSNRAAPANEPAGPPETEDPLDKLLK